MTRTGCHSRLTWLTQNALARGVRPVYINQSSETHCMTRHRCERNSWMCNERNECQLRHCIGRRMLGLRQYRKDRSCSVVIRDDLCAYELFRKRSNERLKTSSEVALASMMSLYVLSNLKFAIIRWRNSANEAKWRPPCIAIFACAG